MHSTTLRIVGVSCFFLFSFQFLIFNFERFFTKKATKKYITSFVRDAILSGATKQQHEHLRQPQSEQHFQKKEQHLDAENHSHSHTHTLIEFSLFRIESIDFDARMHIINNYSFLLLVFQCYHQHFDNALKTIRRQHKNANINKTNPKKYLVHEVEQNWASLL